MVKFSGFIILCFLVILLSWIGTEVGFAQTNGEKYITWDDLLVNHQKFHRGDGGNQKRVIVVDKNGGGDSPTIQGAVNLVPINNAERVKIHIRRGVYSEKVHIPRMKPYISLIGDPHNPSATVVQWHDKASDNDRNGGLIGTWNSSSVTVESDYFCSSGITFQNTVVAQGLGPQGYQAVALRISGDKAVLYKTSILGSQDTLLDERGTHYYLESLIQGSIDFIFGDAKSLFEKCKISVVGIPYAIAAQSRYSGDDNTGFSFVNCTVVGDGPVLLGRAYGDYSRVIYSYTDFDLDVRADGWEDWGAPSRQNTVVFGEYECRGRGADRSGRVRWSRVLSYEDVKPFLDKTYINGVNWLRL